MHALILVDIQNDFLPGGALAVSDGDAVIAVANQKMGEFALTVATQDWHPADHLSFASQHPDKQVGETTELDGLTQILWPDHCIQEFAGAEFAAQLDTSRISHVIQKGTDRTIDSYSGFFDNARRKETGLEKLLRELDVDEVSVMGLATDYCVKFTALDAIDLGFKTNLIEAGVRGVNLQPSDCDDALAEMRSQGISIV